MSTTSLSQNTIKDQNHSSLVCILTWFLIVLIMGSMSWAYIKLISYFLF